MCLLLLTNVPQFQSIFFLIFIVVSRVRDFFGDTGDHIVASLHFKLQGKSAEVPLFL